MIPWLPQFLCDSRVPFHKVFHYRSPIVLDCSQSLWYSASCNRLLQFVSASPGLRKCSLGCHCIVLLWSSTINESLLFQNSSHRNCPSVGRGWSMAPFLWLDWFYGSVSAQELPPRMLPKFLIFVRGGRCGTQLSTHELGHCAQKLTLNYPLTSARCINHTRFSTLCFSSEVIIVGVAWV